VAPDFVLSTKLSKRLPQSNRAVTKHVVVLAISMLLAGCMAQDGEDTSKLIEDAEAEAVAAAKQEDKAPTAKDQAAADAENAHKAADTAKEAAKVATKVAKHSVKITEHAKSALKNAHDALHRARVDTEGLSSDQKASLKKAEKHLREAIKDAEYGQVKDAKYIKAEVEDKKLEKLEKKMDDLKEKEETKEKKDKTEKKEEKKEDNGELEAMRKELEELRKRLDAKGDKSDNDALKELSKQIKDMEEAEKKEDKTDAKSHDEMKAEIEKLREMIKKLEAKEDEAAKKEKKVEEEKEEKKEEEKKKKEKKTETPEEEDEPSEKPVKVEESKSLDIDTAMPYGDLEPFGREDTAQELTENSIKESDEMVDQLERAEVAEEKRAVFRALTRLRGAAITSFDGVARSQTGNIDEYNKVNQWRGTHPLHHLADEESDVSKWAFPDNAD